MAVDNFLKVDGIPGESQDTTHKNGIQVIPWDFKASQTGSSAIGGGSGAAKVKMYDFQFTMYTGKATPKLMEACATVKHIAEANLACRKAGGQPYDYLKVKFNDLIFTSYQTGGSSEIPTESCSLTSPKFNTITTCKTQTVKRAMPVQLPMIKRKTKPDNSVFDQ